MKPEFDWSIMCDSGLCVLCKSREECPDSHLYNPPFVPEKDEDDIEDIPELHCPNCKSENVELNEAPLESSIDIYAKCLDCHFVWPDPTDTDGDDYKPTGPPEHVEVP